MSAPTKFVRAGPAPKIRRVYKEKEEEERVSKSESSADEAPNTAPEPKLRRVYYEADSFSESDDEYAVEKRLLLEERLLEERLQIKLLEMEAERAVAAAVAPATGGDAFYAAIASALPTIEERVGGYRMLEEVDGALSWLAYRGPGGVTPEMRANAAWTLRKLEAAGIDHVAKWAETADGVPYIQMIFHGPHILRPGCVPASLFIADACFHALDGEEPAVTTYEAESVFGELRCLLLTSIGEARYLGKADEMTRLAAGHIVREAVMIVDDLRDPRQRGRPVWAGCGRCDGTPGTFRIGDDAHKGCPILDFTKPLVPRGDRDPQDWCVPAFKEW